MQARAIKFYKHGIYSMNRYQNKEKLSCEKDSPALVEPVSLLCRAVSGRATLKARKGMSNRWQCSAQQECPTWLYSTTSEKLFQGKSAPIL